MATKIDLFEYTISHRGSPHQGKTTSLDTGGQLFQNLRVFLRFVTIYERAVEFFFCLIQAFDLGGVYPQEVLQ